jgi:radical SAM protein with 4Fe4S-binding SPASM domain
MISCWKKYDFSTIETSRRSLKAHFLHYHVKAFRTYFISRYLEKRQYKKQLLCNVNIETTAFCNRKCFFCFNHDRFPKREQGIMDESIFQKVIADLATLKFAGRLSPHSFGEPLLDKRLPALMEYARKKLPLCFIDIHTNGDLLEEGLLVTLLNKGVDHFLITNYDDADKPLLEDLARRYPFPVTFRSYKTFRKTDRAGAIFRRGTTLRAPCLRPSSALVVNWKGNVVLCCHDFYQSCSFGNVKEQSLSDIWYGPEFSEYRKQLAAGNRTIAKICTNCDDEGAVPW